MRNSTTNLTQHVVNVLRIFIAMIVVVGPLTLLNLWFDQMAVVLAVISIIGVLGLVAEGNRLFSSEKGGTDSTE